jgi:hypothetical protein
MLETMLARCRGAIEDCFSLDPHDSILPSCMAAYEAAQRLMKTSLMLLDGRRFRSIAGRACPNPPHPEKSKNNSGRLDAFGATRLSRGAPHGNRNALKTGHHTARIRALRAQARALSRAARALVARAEFMRPDSPTLSRAGREIPPDLR